MSSTAISLGSSSGSAQVFGRTFKSSFVSGAAPIVFVLDDNASVRESLQLLIRREGWRCETFASAQEFFARPRVIVPNCLALGVSVSGLNGLDLQQRLAIERPDMRIIFIADRVDVPTTVKAMKAGAVEFFTKPFQADLMLGSIWEALDCSRVAIAHEREIRELRDRYRGLSRREREVMALVVSGLLNKQIGGELSIAEQTVKAHRGQVMQKMKAHSLPHLVKMAAELDDSYNVATSLRSGESLTSSPRLIFIDGDAHTRRSSA
jgi:FixJ family two-component response regulator